MAVPAHQTPMTAHVPSTPRAHETRRTGLTRERSINEFFLRKIPYQTTPATVPQLETLSNPAF